MRTLLIPIIFWLPLAMASELSPEIQKALAETEARIQKLKAEGKLPTGPELSAATREPAKAKPPSGCTRLEVGGAAIIHYVTDQESPTGVKAAYGLSRHGEKLWLAEVRVHFVKGESYPKPEEANSKVDEAYRKRIGDCLSGYRGKLKGKEGRELIIRLSDNPSIPEQEIQIMGYGFRSNSHQYEANIICPVVLHETLHLLGLVDEYAHKPAMHEDYHDCRPAAPPDSIMGSHLKAELALIPTTIYEIEMCACEKKGTACWELSTKSDGKKCPPGSKSVFEKVDPAIRTSLNAMNTNEKFVLDLGRMRESGETLPPKESILYPAHFRAITEPGCRDVNEAYYSCGQNAYRSSKPASGEEADRCKAVPNACRWRSFKWLE